MLRYDIHTLIEDFGVKKEAIIKQLNTTRPTFIKKMKDNSFDDLDRARVYLKWGKLLS